MDAQKDIPTRMATPIDLMLVDAKLLLWEGEAELTQPRRTKKGKAKVFLDTLPRPNMCFEFAEEETEKATEHPVKQLFKDLNEPRENSSLADGRLRCGEHLGVVDVQPTNSGDILSGRVHSLIHESKKKYKKARYLIINGPKTLGSAVQETSGGYYRARNEVELMNGAEVTIDLLSREKMSSRQVYQFTHLLEVKFETEQQFSEFERIENVLSETLSLVRGRWVGMVGGWFYGENDVSKLSPYVSKTSRNGPHLTWYSDTSFGVFEELLQKIDIAYQDEQKQEVLKTAIHWLTEAQLCSGGVEGALILVQAALEALSWYEVVQARKEMSRNKYDKEFSAHEKIKKLLGYYNIEFDIPSHELEVISYANDFGKTDLIDVLVSMRNALVHADPNKIKRLFDRDSGVPERGSAWYLMVGLLEQAVLAVIGYEGVIIRRDLDVHAKWQATQRVPWVKT